jgi:hypothetical protein
MVDSFVPNSSTNVATFISTNDEDYIYFVNGVKIEPVDDYSILNGTSIQLVVPINTLDVVTQINTKLLKLATEHVHQGMIGPTGLIPEVEFELVDGDLVCNIVGYVEGTEQIEWSLV